ncbi:MAG TPA: LysM peptidoglycan-binding domain-containing protein [Clostridiaceae bacterium]|nr:LysM peptidoglycan-binding domain-containing protein [Clostridiaceae bacterium]
MEILFLGSTGPNVKLIQSLLNRIGYNAGQVDGIFGPRTQAAVMAFQRSFGLTPDGIAGPATWNAFERFLRGYDIYTIRPGDTLYNIAQRYYTTVNAIFTANPGIDPFSLRVGQQIIVPYGIDVVFTDIDYTYEILERQIQGLRARYPFLETGVIGRSVMGKNLYYIRLGYGANEVSYNASHHANEWIGTTLVMKFIENFCKAYSVRGSIRGYNIVDIFNYSSIYIIPMVNPDGVNLVTYWPNYPDPAYNQAALLNTTGLPLPRVWKANIQGVDLNLNYPALWEREKQLELEQGITSPAPRDYGGEAPLSEPETIAMYNFTRSHNFRLVIAYHTQGEVIYWQFNNLAPPESLTIANLFSRASGYTVTDVPPEAAYAGYKDWFIQDFRRPGYTIELGRGINPLPVSQFSTIYAQNEEIMLLAAIV